MDDEDRALFRAEMRDVRPLRGEPRRPPVRTRPRPRARFSREDRLAVLAESLAAAGGALTPVVEAGEELLYRRPSVPAHVFHDLRSGRFRVEAECDLHGLRQHEAATVLAAFLAEALQRGWRVVRIVHGKGLRSGQRGPVLKPMVNAYLQRVGAVLAFANGREVDGGVGATLVLLGFRARRS